MTSSTTLNFSVDAALADRRRFDDTAVASVGAPDQVSTRRATVILAAMEVITLQSGSSGNCVYVETDGVRLLFDAGISGRQAQERLAQHGKDIHDVDALIISHDHSDHTSCMGVYHRKFGLPIYCTPATHTIVDRRKRLGRVSDVRHFDAGETLWFGQVAVETLSTPHDGADGVVFIIDNSRRRFGILTDLGHVFDGLEAAVASLDAVLIESNYDPDMLAQGPYPPALQERISGPGGHISNLEAARLLQRTDSSRLQWACLAHLSDENNAPDVALQTHRQLLGNEFPVSCADRFLATDPLKVEDPCEGIVAVCDADDETSSTDRCTDADSQPSAPENAQSSKRKSSRKRIAAGFSQLTFFDDACH